MFDISQKNTLSKEAHKKLMPEPFMKHNHNQQYVIQYFCN